MASSTALAVSVLMGWLVLSIETDIVERPNFSMRTQQRIAPAAMERIYENGLAVASNQPTLTKTDIPPSIPQQTIAPSAAIPADALSERFSPQTAESLVSRPLDGHSITAATETDADATQQANTHSLQDFSASAVADNIQSRAPEKAAERLSLPIPLLTESKLNGKPNAMFLMAPLKTGAHELSARAMAAIAQQPIASAAKEVFSIVNATTPTAHRQNHTGQTPTPSSFPAPHAMSPAASSSARPTANSTATAEMFSAIPYSLSVTKQTKQSEVLSPWKAALKSARLAPTKTTSVKTRESARLSASTLAPMTAPLAVPMKTPVSVPTTVKTSVPMTVKLPPQYTGGQNASASTPTSAPSPLPAASAPPPTELSDASTSAPPHAKQVPPLLDNIPATGTLWLAQAGSYASAETAFAERERLRNAGFAADVILVYANDHTPWYSLLAGVKKKQSEAQAVCTAFRASMKAPCNTHPFAASKYADRARLAASPRNNKK